MYVCMYTQARVYIYIYIYVICICIYMNICIPSLSHTHTRIHTHIYIYIYIYIHTLHAHKPHSHTHTHTHAYICINTQTDRKTDRQTDRQTDRKTDRQTDNTRTHTYPHRNRRKIVRQYFIFGIFRRWFCVLRDVCVRGAHVCVWVTRASDCNTARFCGCIEIDTGWLRWVGSIKLQFSFAKEPYKRDYILQKRPIIFSILLTVATPYSSFCGYIRIPICLS